MLATGGAAALWSRTTNPPGSYGSGLLLARAAGAELADLEFVQFHPTAVVGIPGREGFLVSEAVRGEGATLHDAHGERFVDELAPRDAVARAIHRLLAATGEPAVYLDMTRSIPPRFPNVVAALREAGHDPVTERVPVAPGEPLRHGRHHRRTWTAAARSPGLYAVGRVRLHRPARRQPARLQLALGVLRVRAPRGARRRSTSRPPAAAPRPAPDVDPRPAADARDARRDVARRRPGARPPTGCARLLDDPHPLARLVAASALAREETRGAHARADFPRTRPRARRAPHGVAAGAERPRFVEWT